MFVSAQIDQALRQAGSGALTSDAWATLANDEETLEGNLAAQAQALTAGGDFGAAGQLWTMVAELNDRMTSILDFLVDSPPEGGPDAEELADYKRGCETLSVFARGQGLLSIAIAQRISNSPGESEASAKEASRLFKSLAQAGGPDLSASLALVAQGVQFAAVATGQQLRFQYRDAARSYLRARRATEKAFEEATKADGDNSEALAGIKADMNTYHATAEQADLMADVVDGDFEGAVTHAEETVKIISSQDDPGLPSILRQSIKMNQFNATAYLAYVRAEVAANNNNWDEAEHRIAEADHQWHQVVMMAMDMDIPQSGQMAAAAQMISFQATGTLRRRIRREKEFHAEIAELRTDNQALHREILQMAQDAKTKIQTEVVGMSSDRYDINGSQAGAIGPNATVSNNQLHQENVQNSLSGVDMNQLAQQLQVLTEKLKTLAADPDQYAALSEVSYAAQAASKQDKNGTLEHLKKAGVWALQVAKDIGVQVAATALTAAL
jgi:hypothetical protein